MTLTGLSDAETISGASDGLEKVKKACLRVTVRQFSVEKIRFKSH